jgi:hypothetical protein
MKIRSILTAFLLFAAIPVLHAECDADHPEQCTVQTFRDALHKSGSARDTAVARVEEEVGNQNRATTAPDPFAARLHNSYEDFVAPFSFAINKIEESKDGRALIVRLNVIRHGSVKVGLTGTAAKPKLFGKIAEGIPSAERDDVLAKLDGKLKDFDDITIAGSLSFEKAQCLDLQRLCFGRNPQTYRQELSRLLSPLLVEAAKKANNAVSERADRALRGLLEANQLKDNTSIASIQDAGLRSEVVAAIRNVEKLDKAASAAAVDFLKVAGIDNLASLIDNQPQLAFTGSWRQLGNLGGPDELALSAEFQYGSNNLRRAAKNLLGILQRDPTSLPSDKFVFSASYKRATRYKLDSLAGTGVSFDAFTPIDVPRTSEWNARAQWGRKLGVTMSKDHQARFDLSGEFQRNGKGGVRTKNRVVATATLTVPVLDSLSFPVSLKYANKPEFLTDSRKDLSLHFGVSYRLPWEAK